MFLLFQAVAQQIPPIQVTVQQAGTPPGLPEWIKILITAGVGAVFGFSSSVLMEFLKPYIAKRGLKKTIERQLGDELVKGLNELSGVTRTFKKVNLSDPVERKILGGYTRVMVNVVKRDRYDFYFATEKALVYEIDEGNLLGAFYSALTSLPKMTEDPDDAKELIQMLLMGSEIGKRYVEAHKLSYTPTRATLEGAYDAIRTHQASEEVDG
jgi:hypothetical protein